MRNYVFSLLVAMVFPLLASAQFGWQPPSMRWPGKGEFNTTYASILNNNPKAKFMLSGDYQLGDDGDDWYALITEDSIFLTMVEYTADGVDTKVTAAHDGVQEMRDGYSITALLDGASIRIWVPNPSLKVSVEKIPFDSENADEIYYDFANGWDTSFKVKRYYCVFMDYGNKGVVLSFVVEPQDVNGRNTGFSIGIPINDPFTEWNDDKYGLVRIYR